MKTFTVITFVTVVSILAIGSSSQASALKISAERNGFDFGSLTESSVHAYSAPDHIMFAADDEAFLFVNGVEKGKVTDWVQFAYVPLSVKKGDVIALKVNDRSGWYGAIAELVLNNIMIATGRDEWLASKGNRNGPLDWTLQSYSKSKICSWERAQVLPEERIWRNGKALLFKDPTAARYVWERNSGESDTIYLRHRVGGEDCNIASQILYTGDNVVELFVNGVFKSVSTTWETFKSVDVTLSTGDVVALRARDEGVWFGAIAAIKRGEWHSTGNGEWRATKKFKIEGNANAWMLPSYSACRWPKPILRDPGVIVPGKAKLFPYQVTGAEYVWAPNAGVRDTIFLRYVVGGQC